MNILKITQSNKSYILEFNGQRTIMLNMKALVWHLKHKVGLDAAARGSVLNILNYEPFVEVDLTMTDRKVS